MEKKVNMLTYNFENIGSDTLYQYLYKCIKNDIIQVDQAKEVTEDENRNCR